MKMTTAEAVETSVTSSLSQDYANVDDLPSSTCMIHYVAPCCVVLCCVGLCCAVLYCVVLCCVVLCHAVFNCVGLCCVVLCCVVLRCIALYCGTLRRAVLCCSAEYCMYYVVIICGMLRVLWFTACAMLLYTE